MRVSHLFLYCLLKQPNKKPPICKVCHFSFFKSVSL
nr:MAG TPA: optinuerin [Caudoviricetes sp.]